MVDVYLWDKNGMLYKNVQQVSECNITGKQLKYKIYLQIIKWVSYKELWCGD